MSEHETAIAHFTDDDDDRGDSPQTIWRRGLLYRAEEAIQGATYEECWSTFSIDDEVVTKAKQAVAAWHELAAFS
jgi:hypothetical protein